MKIKIKGKKNKIFPRLAKIIFVFADGVVIQGDGKVDAVGNNRREAIFTATLVKKIPK